MLLRFLVEMERKQKSDIHNREVLDVYQIVQWINHNDTSFREQLMQDSEQLLATIKEETKYIKSTIYANYCWK
ncbi:hypothetical protein [Ammoniphilus sp. 3BR4]|uniref:hypothetical protein n=1 Tax=Ammoniphilus sp. 3BR4 TaxID=3158265 RepID=UPI003467C611